MIHDVFIVAWKEWQEYLHHGRSRRFGLLRSVAFVVAGGVFVGWQLDPDFGRTWLTAMLTTFVCIMFVSTVAPDSFAGERERHTLETLLASRLPDRAILLGKLAAAVSYGWAIALVVLPAGVVAANLIHGAPGIPWFDAAVVASAAAFSLAAGGLIGALGVLMSLYSATARQAHQRLGLVILGIFMTPAVLVSGLPRAWAERLLSWIEQVGVGRLGLVVFALLALAGVGLTVLAMLRFRRARLIL